MSKGVCKLGDILLDGYGNAYGFYDGMKKFLIDGVADYINNADYERAGDFCEMLEELEKFVDSYSMLILSEHNGMGWGIDEYKGGAND